LAAGVDGTAFQGWAAGSALAYPVANVLHVIGVVLLVGSAWAMDLRVLGMWRQLPMGGVLRAGRPVAILGLALLVPTGLLMFAADAEALAQSPVFRWKLVVVLAAVLNAVAFQFSTPDRSLAVTRAMAAGSALGWLVVLGLGRWIAYA
jgi:hypothetical protein